MNVLCIDPGGKHTGLAIWRNRNGWGCEWASEIGTSELIEWLSGRVGAFDAVVYEQYRLRSGTAQGGSSLAMIESIGVIHALAFRSEVPVHSVSPSTRASALKRIRASGIPWVGVGPHAHDAQAVGLAWLKIPVSEVRVPTVE